MKIIGIDVGFSGAIATYIDNDYSVVDMPIISSTDAKSQLDMPEIASILMGAYHVFIERAQTMPKQGVSSQGRYMMSYGQLLGICAALQVPYTTVTPQAWKKVELAGLEKGKSTSIFRAKQMFPSIDLHRQKDHGKAEALLILHYGMVKEKLC
jgi:crossover junction endodeoxyribonuclease RuvC